MSVAAPLAPASSPRRSCSRPTARCARSANSRSGCTSSSRPARFRASSISMPARRRSPPASACTSTTTTTSPARTAATATAIAKGCDVKAMMAEIYGRETGICHGKGGSMHIADLSQGHDGRQRHRRRRRAAGLRRGLAAKIRGTEQVGDHLRRRRRVQPGHVPGEPEPRRRLAPAGGLRRREQRLRRVDLARVPPAVASTSPSAPTASACRASPSTARLLRRLRGGRRGDRARPRRRRPVAARMQGRSATSAISRATRRPTAGRARSTRSARSRDCLDALPPARHRGRAWSRQRELDGDRRARSRADRRGGRGGQGGAAADARTTC